MLGNLVRFDSRFKPIDVSHKDSSLSDYLYYDDKYGLMMFVDVNFFRFYCKTMFKKWGIDSKYIKEHRSIVNGNIEISVTTDSYFFGFADIRTVKDSFCWLYIDKDSLEHCNTFNDLLAVEKVKFMYLVLKKGCSRGTHDVFRFTERLKPYKCKSSDIKEFIDSYMSRFDDVRVMYLKYKLLGYFDNKRGV